MRKTKKKLKEISKQLNSARSIKELQEKFNYFKSNYPIKILLNSIEVEEIRKSILIIGYVVVKTVKYTTVVKFNQLKLKVKYV